LGLSSACMTTIVFLGQESVWRLSKESFAAMEAESGQALWWGMEPRFILRCSEGTQEMLRQR
jgi:hypothetical protein